MFIEFELENNHIKRENYVNKPIVRDEIAIGIITNAIEKGNKRVVIKAVIWDNFININVGDYKIDGLWNCAEINISI